MFVYIDRAREHRVIRSAVKVLFAAGRVVVTKASGKIEKIIMSPTTKISIKEFK